MVNYNSPVIKITHFYVIYDLWIKSTVVGVVFGQLTRFGFEQVVYPATVNGEQG